MNKKIYIENSTPCIVLDGSVYEIENPNAAGVMQNGKFFLWHTESNGSYKHTESEGVDCEWPYGVELIDMPLSKTSWESHAEFQQRKAHSRMPQLARLIPEEKKAESAYKEFHRNRETKD